MSSTSVILLFDMTFQYVLHCIRRKINEPRHDKTNKMSAHSEDSDQPGQSDQSIRWPHEESLGP